MKHLKRTNLFFRDLYKSRRLIFDLAINDFRSRYSGSFFGIIWAFVQPMVTILVFWFVFQIGFKTPPIKNMPFMLWFIPAYIPWVFFSDAVMMSTGCLYEYSYLVKKVKFRTGILPLIKVITASFVHFFFISFIFLVYILYRIPIKLQWLQLFYYTFALMALLLGLAWLFSAISVFFRDFGQFINIGLQIGFWLTPIFWDPQNMNPLIGKILKFNPMYYIVQGYRDCFINNDIWFWYRYKHMLYYWVVVTIILFSGSVIYKKLRPHFSDVL